MRHIAQAALYLFTLLCIYSLFELGIGFAFGEGMATLTWFIPLVISLVGFVFAAMLEEEAEDTRPQATRL